MILILLGYSSTEYSGIIRKTAVSSLCARHFSLSLWVCIFPVAGGKDRDEVDTYPHGGIFRT